MKDCKLWSGAKQKNGYGHLGRNGKTFLAHRVAFHEAFGLIPDGMLVLHKCDNRLCVNPDHLFLGTAKDNTHDMMKKGRGSWGHTFGERNAKSKLTDIQVREILSVYKPQRGATAALARKFGCGWNTVKNIVSGRTRKSAVIDNSITAKEAA